MAACIYSNKNAVQTQSYGPESRGGSCRSEVVIADDEIDYPKVDDPDIVVLMSEEAHRKYMGLTKQDATILVDPDMVTTREIDEKKVYLVPASKIAKELGKPIIANVVMLGALTSITRIVTNEAMEKAVLRNVPKGTEELNLRALRKGFAYGNSLREDRDINPGKRS